MFYFKHRVLVWWITLVIVLAGSLMHSAQATFMGGNDATNSTITLEICTPTGERLSYSITLDEPDTHSAHSAVHCLFCILPGSVDTIIDSTPIIRLSEYEPIEKITFPSYHYVPTQHDRWLPHRALAPPIIV